MLLLSRLFGKTKKSKLFLPLDNINRVLKKLLRLKPMSTGFVSTTFRESLEGKWPPTEAKFFEDAGIQASEVYFNRYCEKMSGSSAQPETPSIPRIIHIIWLGSKPPKKVEIAVESWRRCHPNWELKLWENHDLENFAWTTPNSKAFFDHAENWIEKSDILRFEILYQFGGIYSDTDAVCLKSFEDLVSNGIAFFAGLESNLIQQFGRPLLGSAILGARKKHPILRRCMDFSLTREQAPTTLQYIRSGPGPVTQACYEALEKGAKDIVIFPCSYFYPLNWKARLSPASKIINYIRPESFSVHLWEGSWFDSSGTT